MEYLERNKEFKVSGNSYSMPRRIVELLHYEQKSGSSQNWVNRVFALCAKNFSVHRKGERYFCRVKSNLRPNLLRRLALEFKRDADIEAFNAQFRKDTRKDSDKINYQYIREVCKREEAALENRRKLAEKIDIINLSKQKYA